MATSASPSSSLLTSWEWTSQEVAIMVLPDSTTSLSRASHPGLLVNNTAMEKELMMVDLINTDTDTHVTSTTDSPDNVVLFTAASVTESTASQSPMTSVSMAMEPEVLTVSLEDGSLLQLRLQAAADQTCGETLAIGQEVVVPFVSDKLATCSATSTSLSSSSSSLSKRRESKRRPLPSLESLKKSLLSENSSSPMADLGNLLMAANIELELEELVETPLAVVKRRMQELRLSEWQTALCIKIRRRMKNTAAVRSSRQKRSAYVSELRDHVHQLEQRRRELLEERQLLRQLRHLWQRLEAEVQAEVQQGIVNRMGKTSVQVAKTLRMESTNKAQIAAT